MTKIIQSLILLIILPSTFYAHSLLLNVFDNNDNTIEIEALFSTGEVAEGAEILLKSSSTNDILYKKRIPLEGELMIDIPKEPYIIVLNGGPGHIIEKQGISPINGFIAKENSKTKVLAKDKTNIQDTILSYGLLLSFILLFLTMFISIKNTNKIMNSLRESKKN